MRGAISVIAMIAFVVIGFASAGGFVISIEIITILVLLAIIVGMFIGASMNRTQITKL